MKEGWKYSKIKDIGTVIGGTTPSTSNKEYWGGNNCWISPAELDGSHYLYDSVKKITDKAVKEKNLKLLPVGTVILSSRAPIGKVTINNVPTYCNQGFKCVICGEEVINEFLYWWFWGNTEYLNSLGTGATFKEISKTVVENITIPIPPLSEQQRIVTYLDDAFAKIDLIKQNAEKSLSEAKALFQSALKEMMEPKEGWEEKTLKDVVDANTAISYGIVQPGDDVENGIPVVRPVDLTQKRITLTAAIKRTSKENSDAYKRTILNGKEILMCVRGTTGVVSLTDSSFDGSNVTRGIVPIKITDETLRTFVYYSIIAPMAAGFIQRNTRGAALKQINIADVKLTPISIPPLSDQQQIVSQLDTLSKTLHQLESNYTKTVAECDALKQALLRQVFE